MKDRVYTIQARDVVAGMIMGKRTIERVEIVGEVRRLHIGNHLFRDRLPEETVEIRLPSPSPRELLCTCRCAHCGNGPICRGAYEGHEPVGHACDQCCGHGNEDGWCRDWERIAPPTDHADSCPVRRLRLRLWPAPHRDYAWIWDQGDGTDEHEMGWWACDEFVSLAELRHSFSDGMRENADELRAAFCEPEVTPMIPAIEQVREHAERCPVNHKGFNGCLWLMQWDSLLPEIRLLHATNGVVEIWDEGEHEWLEYSDFYDPIRCDPCDPSGNPLPLVEEWNAKVEEIDRLIAVVRDSLETERARADDLARELDASRWVAAAQVAAAHKERDDERSRANTAEADLASMEIWVAGADERQRILLAAKEEWRQRVVQAEIRLSAALGLPSCTLEQACAALEMAAERCREP